MVIGRRLDFSVFKKGVRRICFCRGRDFFFCLGVYWFFYLIKFFWRSRRKVFWICVFVVRRKVFVFWGGLIFS